MCMKSKEGYVITENVDFGDIQIRCGYRLEEEASIVSAQFIVAAPAKGAIDMPVSLIHLQIIQRPQTRESASRDGLDNVAVQRSVSRPQQAQNSGINRNTNTRTACL